MTKKVAAQCVESLLVQKVLVHNRTDIQEWVSHAKKEIFTKEEEKKIFFTDENYFIAA